MIQKVLIYTGAKKYWHPYLINTIEMRSFWTEIKYVKKAARLLDRSHVNKRGLDLSNEVLWVSVGQRTVKILAFKVESWKKILPIGLAWAKQVQTRKVGIILFCPPTLIAGSSGALWPTETQSTSLERSKPPLLTHSLFKTLAALLMYFISI